MATNPIPQARNSKTTRWLVLLSSFLVSATAIHGQDDLPRLRVGDITVREGTSGQAVFLPLRVDGVASTGIQFLFETRNGTAVAGRDYEARSGSGGVSAGSTIWELPLVVLADDLVEGPETFFVQLRNVTGAVVVKSSGRVTILDRSSPSPSDPGADDGADGNSDSDRFEDLVPQTGAGNARDLAALLDRTCGNAAGQHKKLCDYLRTLPREKRLEAIKALLPKGMTAQGDVALRSQQHQVKNVASRQAQLRAGVRAGSNNAVRNAAVADAFEATIDGQTLSIGEVARASRRPTTRQAIDQALTRELGELRAGKGANANPQAGDDQRTLEEAGESRLGFFVNGRYGEAEHDATVLEPGYDVDSYGMTAGVDYKLGRSGWMGVALGYSDSTTNLRMYDYELGLNGFSLSLYSGMQRGRFYLDGALTYGQLDLDVSRRVQLPAAFDGANDIVVWAQSETTQANASLSAGYDLRLGRVEASTFVRGFYSEADVDPYEENGPAPLTLSFERQSLDSGLGEAGIEFSLPISTSWGAIFPTARVSYLHEFGDNARSINTRFAFDTNDRFRLATDNADTDYLMAALGLNVTLPGTRLLYLMLEQDFERDDFSQTMVYFGYRQQLP